MPNTLEMADLRAIAARSALPMRYSMMRRGSNALAGAILSFAASRIRETIRREICRCAPRIGHMGQRHARKVAGASGRGGFGGNHAARFLAFLCSNSTIVREILACASRMALPLDIAHLSKYRWLIPSGT